MTTLDRNRGLIVTFVALSTTFVVSAPAQSPIVQTEVVGVPAGELANVCHISSRRALGLLVPASYNGSAVLYRQRYLITAAHNVFSPFYAPIKELAVACGKAAPVNVDHVAIELSQTRTAAGYDWLPSKRFDRDFAVVKLPEPIADGVPLQLGAGRVTDATAVAVRIAGFPGLEREGSRMNGRRMFTATGRAARSSDGRFLGYDVETVPGNSGGPVWITSNGVPYLVGIHVRPSQARIVDAEFVQELNRMIDDIG